MSGETLSLSQDILNRIAAIEKRLESLAGMERELSIMRSQIESLADMRQHNGETLHCLDRTLAVVNQQLSDTVETFREVKGELEDHARRLRTIEIETIPDLRLESAKVSVRVGAITGGIAIVFAALLKFLGDLFIHTR